jgi:hypothetical protein
VSKFTTHRDVLNYHGPPPRRDAYDDPQAWEYLREIVAMIVTAIAFVSLFALSAAMLGFK